MFQPVKPKYLPFWILHGSDMYYHGNVFLYYS